MIEISARLIKGSVFLAGEVVECYITFSNPPYPNHKKFHGSSDVIENLALASAQIHCQCTTNSKLIQNQQNSDNDSLTLNTQTDTSFAPCKTDSGYVVLSTKPKILFCDLRLATGESKSWKSYRVKHRHHTEVKLLNIHIKYHRTQRINSPIKLLRIPFRVLSISGISDSSGCNDSEDLMPTNPFLEKEKKDSPLEITLQILQNITARRNPNFYNITNIHGKVARFCLFKQAYKLGEDIVGTFDFTDTTVQCVQYSVTLQSEEEVQADNKRTVKQGPSIVSYNKQHEICLSWKYLQLILPIPFHITPGFNTNLVSLQWRLHFEFVTSLTPISNDDIEMNEKDDKTWQGPSSLNIETMIWNLPIKILPTAPQLVTQGIPGTAKNTIII
ncbi:conserved hypothetical protein [Pediculus humanus corporis]|uniref:Retrograde Golgi transport protein RGP1 n=1 Tax=Pediculus humanus subsp. corporis TaxID=121224 RepID=E0VV71_PEDHC|nr:uncharacterized protein Phum_PHUM459180 [Pediculus humanus corporis]EEB17277.1 conserved hypothetical protein [Pediculus humanus corporis]